MNLLVLADDDGVRHYPAYAKIRERKPLRQGMTRGGSTSEAAGERRK